MQDKIRVLIADDHAVIREGIRHILQDEPGVEVVGEAKSGREAVELALKLVPDVVIMDISMPDLNGLEATREIRAGNDSINILGLTIHESPEYFFSMIEAGAAGYLMKKDATSVELMNALRCIHESGVYLHPTVAKWLIRDRLAKSHPIWEKPAESGLTSREVEILRLVADGYNNQQIAGMLHISSATVQTHSANIMQKINLHSRVALVKYALSRGLIHLDK